MRIPSGKTDQLIYFVAVDSTDLKTRKTALSGFVVYRSRNGGVATIYTTPTVAELSAANMPGVYSLAIDEDTTIAAGSDSEEYCVHITVATMAPVTRVIELYRRDTTSGQTLTVATGTADANVTKLLGTAWLAPAVAGTPDINVKSFTNNAITTVAFTAGAVNSTVAPNLDAAITSRMATYAQPTGFLAATFPLTVASTTNITAGTITTTTNLTNLPAITANWLTAAGTAADFGTEVAAAIWQDAVPGDFIVASSIGKSLYTGNVVPGAANGHFIAGANTGTTVNFTGNLSGSVGSVTAAVTVGAINAGVITAASIATDAIDADALAADAVTEIWAASTAPTSAAIGTAVWDRDATAHQTLGTFGQAIGDPVADANTIYKAVVTDAAGATVGVDVVAVKADTAAILIDTIEIGVAGAGLTNIDLPNQTMDITGNLSGSVGSVTGLTAAVVHADLDDIQTRLPAALIGGRMNSDVEAINNSTVAAVTLAILNGAAVIYNGTVTGAATTTTLIDTGLTQADTDWWKGRIIIFTSVITLQATDITGFDPATDKLTFTAVTAAPTAATYVIV